MKAFGNQAGPFWAYGSHTLLYEGRADAQTFLSINDAQINTLKSNQLIF